MAKKKAKYKNRILLHTKLLYTTSEPNRRGKGEKNFAMSEKVSTFAPAFGERKRGFRG